MAFSQSAFRACTTQFINSYGEPVYSFVMCAFFFVGWGYVVLHSAHHPYFPLWCVIEAKHPPCKRDIPWASSSSFPAQSSSPPSHTPSPSWDYTEARWAQADIHILHIILTLLENRVALCFLEGAIQYTIPRLKPRLMPISRFYKKNASMFQCFSHILRSYRQ